MGFLGLIGFGGGATGLSNVSGSGASGLVAATGGDVYTAGDYKLHVFTNPNSDNFSLKYSINKGISSVLEFKGVSSIGSTFNR